MNIRDKIVRQRDCDMCDLMRERTQVVVSDGRIAPCPLVAIGEGPGAEEDKIGKPFVGRSGQLLREYVWKYANLELGVDIVVLNTVSCRPPDNRNPFKSEIEACMNWLKLNLAVINPRALLLIGKVAAATFIKGNPQRGVFYGGLDLRKEWRKERYSFKAFTIFHPAYILRNQTVEKKAEWATDIKEFGDVLRDMGVIS